MSTCQEARTGSLVVVGTGIRMVGQLTSEAIAWMKQADRLLYLVGDPIAEEAVRQMNPSAAESLLPFYVDGGFRQVAYHKMVELILKCVRSGMLTCVAAYGHPGVFAFPFHEAIRQARALGYRAKMLPGISAEDCLFADLGIDPASNGCQSYEATDFLLHDRVVDPSASLVLWQVGGIGDPLYRNGVRDRSLLPLFIARLCQFYPPTHVCTLYEASVFPDTEPNIRQSPLHALGDLPITWASTLYIAPCRESVANPMVLSRIGALLVAAARGRAEKQRKAQPDQDA